MNEIHFVLLAKIALPSSSFRTFLKIQSNTKYNVLGHIYGDTYEDEHQQVPTVMAT